MEVEALHCAVEGLLSEANDCLHREPTSQVHQHLQGAGFKKLPQLYKSAHQDLKVLKGLQKLNVPASLKRDEEVSVSAYAGCLENFAGISDARFVEANSTDLGAKQAWHRQLCPEVEERLHMRCLWLAKILEHSGDLSSLVEATAQEVESLEAIEHQNASLLLELVEDVKCHMQLLSLLLDQQAAFIAQQKLTTQKELDLKDSAYLQANCKAQMLKVKVIEQRLLSFTYTDQTVPALKAVERHLAAAEQETDTTHQQLTLRLKQYQELGPEFSALAERYQKLLEDLRHAEFTLEEFQQAAASTSFDSP